MNGAGSRNGGGGSREGSGSPTVQLHKLCSHVIGGAGGDQELISSHYKYVLKL